LAEYLISVVMMSFVLGIISFVSYPSQSEKAAKFSSSVLLLYTAIIPIMSLAQGLSEGDLKFNFSDTGGSVDMESEEYIEVAEKAFEDGISKLLFAKYNLSSEEAEVSVYGFEFDRMRAERIKIVLSGKGILSDYRGIASYITESGLGTCEVAFDFG